MTIFGFTLTSGQSFIAGVAGLWIFSALVGALPAPTTQSSPFYTWLFKFLKTISGDLGSTFGKYIPPAATGTMIALLCFALIFVPVVGLTGCSVSQVEQEVTTVLTEATNVIAIADPGAAWLGDLKSAVAALKTAEASWTAGGKVQLVIDALNTVEAITSVIPLTAAFSPLIDVLVAGIEACLAALPQAAPAVSGTPAAVKAHAVVANPHKGRVTIKRHLFESPAKAFTRTWNQAAAQSNLAAATIQ